MNTQTSPLNCENLSSSTPPPSGLISGVTSAIGQRVSAAFARLKIYNNDLLNRRAFRTLLELDDTMLNDIGVTRSELQWANKLPLSVNAAEELNRISLIRRRGEEL